MDTVADVYRRAWVLMRDWPLLILVPVLAELVQHVVEIRLNMYSTEMSSAGRNVRLGYGIVKIAAIFCTLVVAWRLWKFDGNVSRALRPSARLLGGIGTFILVQVLGDLVQSGSRASSLRSCTS